MGLTMVNQLLISETKSEPFVFPWETNETENRKDEANKKSMMAAANDAIMQWVPLMKDARVRNVVLLNGVYWLALSGSQITCLPLMLTNPEGPFVMSATSVGQVYMGMSIVQVVANPIVGIAADKLGKVRAIVGGGTILSLSIAAMSMSSDLYQLTAAMGCWALGSTMLSSAPIAHVSDLVSTKKRSQAVALLRTSGDVGFFVGASTIGMIADLTGDLGLAVQSGSGILFAGTSWFAARQFLYSKEQPAQKIDCSKNGK